jgi:hypothetical protein
LLNYLGVVQNQLILSRMFFGQRPVYQDAS